MSIFTKTSGTASNDPTKLQVALRNKVVDESEKFAESLKKQITGQDENKNTAGGSNLVHDIITQGGTVNPLLGEEEEREIVAQDKKRLAELEAEMRNLRMQRSQGVSDYSQKIQSEFDASKKTDQPETFVMPAGIKRGPKGQKGKGQSKGSGEMLKSKK